MSEYIDFITYQDDAKNNSEKSSHLRRNEIYFDSIRVNAIVYLGQFPLGRPCQLFLLISFKTLILLYQQKLETRTNPHSEVVRNVSMSISSTISTSFCHDAYCTCSLNPCFYRKHEVVASCCISNCIEFGTIKIRII